MIELWPSTYILARFERAHSVAVIAPADGHGDQLAGEATAVLEVDGLRADGHGGEYDQELHVILVS